jgi:hypothetical protein
LKHSAHRPDTSPLFTRESYTISPSVKLLSEAQLELIIDRASTENLSGTLHVHFFRMHFVHITTIANSPKKNTNNHHITNTNIEQHKSRSNIVKNKLITKKSAKVPYRTVVFEYRVSVPA